MCSSMIAISPIRPPSRTVSRIVLPLRMRSVPCLTMYIALASSPSRNSTSPGFNVMLLASSQAARISSTAISLIMLVREGSLAFPGAGAAVAPDMVARHNGTKPRRTARGCAEVPGGSAGFLDFSDRGKHACLGEDLRQHGRGALLVVEQIKRHAAAPELLEKAGNDRVAPSPVALQR